jgi:uncharacterized small protein (DUF1192 family)
MGENMNTLTQSEEKRATEIAELVTEISRIKAELEIKTNMLEDFDNSFYQLKNSEPCVTITAEIDFLNKELIRLQKELNQYVNE